MLNLGPKKSAVDRRMSELLAEQAAVSGDIKTLSKALRKDPEKVKVPPLKTTNVPPHPDDVEMPQVQDEQLVLGAETSLGWTARPAQDDKPIVKNTQPPLEDGLLPSELKGTENGRFTSYFGAGSIKAARPLRQEQSVQRNKAIFMVVLVLLGFFIVFSIVL